MWVPGEEESFSVGVSWIGSVIAERGADFQQGRLAEVGPKCDLLSGPRTGVDLELTGFHVNSQNMIRFARMISPIRLQANQIGGRSDCRAGSMG